MKTILKENHSNKISVEDVHNAVNESISSIKGCNYKRNQKSLQSSVDLLHNKHKQQLRLSSNQAIVKCHEQFLNQFTVEQIDITPFKTQEKQQKESKYFIEAKKTKKKLASFKSLQSTDVHTFKDQYENVMKQRYNQSAKYILDQEKNYIKVHSFERTQNLYNINSKNMHLNRQPDTKHDFSYKSVQTTNFEKNNFIQTKRKQLIKDLNDLKDNREKKTIFKAPAFLRDKVVLDLPNTKTNKIIKQSNSIPKNFKVAETMCFPSDYGIYKYIEQIEANKTKKMNRVGSSNEKAKSEKIIKKLEGGFFKKSKNRQDGGNFQVGKVIKLKSINCQNNTKQVTLKILKVLAQSPGSCAYLVLQKQTSFIFCLKKSQVNLSNQTTQCKIIDNQQNLNLIGSLIRQSKIGMTLDHPYLIKTYCTLYDDKHIFQLMEFVEGSTLQNHNNKRKAYRKKYQNYHRLYNGIHQSSHIREIVTELTQAIMCLHENGVTHRDLKPANIFISNNHAFKIGDFGCSIYNPPLDFVGTLDYVAPEILMHHNHGKPVDMWAIGCIAYQLYTGSPPFYHPNRQATIQKIVKCRYDLNLIEDKNLKNFIDALIKKQPSKRLTAAEALEHPLIKEYLLKKQQL